MNSHSRAKIVVAALLVLSGVALTLTNTAEALPTAKQSAFSFFRGKGLTGVQAAGIVGNLVQESGVNPNSVQIGGPGRGIAQWSVGGRWNTTPGANVLLYARQHLQSPQSLALQLSFIWFELTSFPGYGLAALRASTTITGATFVFQSRYEICGLCNAASRVANARAVLAAFGP